jgi:hypothetical protein
VTTTIEGVVGASDSTLKKALGGERERGGRRREGKIRDASHGSLLAWVDEERVMSCGSRRASSLLP